MTTPRTYRLVGLDTGCSVTIEFFGGRDYLPPDVAQAIAAHEPPGETFRFSAPVGEYRELRWMGGQALVSAEVAEEIERTAVYPDDPPLGCGASPAVMLGKSCLTGTRITVEEIRTRLHAGEAVDDIIAAYPGHDAAIREIAASEPPFRYGGEGVKP